MRIAATLAVACLALLGAVPPAAAEQVVVALSMARIEIESDFTGADLSVFGVVERDAATVSRPGGYDVAVVVRGPPEAVITRRKHRFLGIWMTEDSRTFPTVPSFYSVDTTRPLAEIAGERMLAADGIGLADADFGERYGASGDAFRAALVRLKVRTGLFDERPGTVELLTPAFFRARVPLPAIVSDGAYTVEVHVFADGSEVARATRDFTIAKIGFEESVHRIAVTQPVLYGLGVVALALLTGWLGGVVFRRD